MRDKILRLQLTMSCSRLKSSSNGRLSTFLYVVMSDKCSRALSKYVFLSRTQTPMFLSAGRMVILLLFLRLVIANWRCSGILILGNILSWRFVEREILCLWSIDSNGGYLVGGFQFGLGSLKGLEGGELDFLKKCLSLKDLLRFWYS